MQEIQVYNTLTKRKEVFHPLEEGKVGIYVCGVTPYNHPHIGNARPFVTWDVIHRFLEYCGYEVRHIQNFTDVDDKIIQTARLAERSWDAIAEDNIEAYFEAMDALHVRRADCYPRVSEHMDDIIAMIEGLIANGHAYPLHGDVYYDISTFADYGALSGRSVEDMLAGARVEVDGEKRHPGDFALWKAAKPDEPAWDSPWGPGRPGWHIECSAMSTKYLGDTFDFHGGGSDLIFPHHENEIAQSEGCTGHHFVNYWVHNGFITINQEKMSKSLDNFFLVKDILAHYSADALRFFLISTHYRSPLDFSDERLEEAQRTLERIDGAIGKARFHLAQAEDVDNAAAAELRDASAAAKAEFIAAMSDDFNTAMALGVLFTFVRKLNTYLAEETAPDRGALDASLTVLHEMTDVLGILPQSWEAAAGADEDAYRELMTVILGVRDDARAQKQYAIADAIRDRLQEIGITLEDGPEGTVWTKSEV